MSLLAHHARNHGPLGTKQSKSLVAGFAHSPHPKARSGFGVSLSDSVVISSVPSFHPDHINFVKHGPPLQNGEVYFEGRAGAAVCQDFTGNLRRSFLCHDSQRGEQNSRCSSDKRLHEFLPDINPFLQSRRNRSEGKCDPKLFDILVERTAIFNRALSYLLSAFVVFGLGFLAATVGF